MSSIEQTLVARVSSFVTTMTEITARSDNAGSEVEKHISSFNETTSNVLGELSQLAAQFDTHGRALIGAAELVEQSNSRTEGALAQRQSVLDGLVSVLDGKTNELEERLQRFSHLLDQSLENASGRAREIARVVADSSTEGRRAIEETLQTVGEQAGEIARLVGDASTDGRRAIDESLQSTVERANEIVRMMVESSSQGAYAITEQFEHVRSASDAERERTHEALREVYEQSITDLHSYFQQTTERFTETIEGMRQMAAEMQQELESTRTELRRGILDLPEETAESAAQMRRVIIDQIEALAELNRIVARHGRAADTAEPVRRVQEPVAAIAGAGRGEVGPRLVTRGDAARGEMHGGRMEPARDITGAPRRPDAPSLSPAQGNGNGRSGWLSDILHRASRDEDDRPQERSPRGEERPARHSLESLDSLSVDIARMIDHEAAVELWDRYKNGETNIFTRRLYTLQGQKTFDEIRRRYRADREFHQTVDRYVGEFERLLDDVSRDDRGQVVARTYLTSDTGKVYLMLAHAAGRFE
jgi:chaperonin cofactor prefoldin/archaellum component FlaC